LFSNQHLSDRQLPWVGVSLTGLILALGWMIAWRWQSHQLAVITPVAGALFAAVFYLVPRTRRPIHRAFSICVYPIQFLVTVALLAIVYFGVVAPIGICLRLSGFDPLDRLSKTDAESPSTYWVKRDPTPPAGRYFKTY
jgi:hypothetical protein